MPQPALALFVSTDLLWFLSNLLLGCRCFVCVACCSCRFLSSRSLLFVVALAVLVLLVVGVLLSSSKITCMHFAILLPCNKNNPNTFRKG